MRVLILTPLFPPDVSPAAVYAKRLTMSLSAVPALIVTVVHYGQFPEKAGEATLVSVKKDTGIPQRLLSFTKRIWLLRHHDLIIILNGPSVEVPYLLISPFSRGQHLYIKNDLSASQAQRWLLKILHILVQRRVAKTITPTTDLLTPPFLHPLDEATKTAHAAFITSWEHHMATITKLCQN
jgi:hypothetical protein